MTKIDHPWQVGPTELIEFALERMHKGTDFDRRLAFLILDVGVETLFKTFLVLPDSVTHAKTNFPTRSNAAQGGFHALVQGVRDALPDRAAKFDLTHVQYYHDIRNTLYHQGNTVATVRDDQLRGYAELAVNLLHEYLSVDLSPELILPELELPAKAGNDPVVDSVEFELKSGRFRAERLKSNAIRIVALDTGQLIEPVKPFLREIIEELSLLVNLTLTTGKDRNTQSLGRDVIEALKPSAWHGWVAGQKITKDRLVSELTGRIRAGKADQKNWEIVDFVRNLKDEELIFQPVGRGWGNSPFNLNCWTTLSGDPIKKS